MLSSDFREVIAKPWSNTELIKKNHRSIDSTIRVKEVLIQAKFEQIDRASKETKEVVHKNNDNIKKVLERLIASETKLDMILQYSKKQAFTTAQKDEEEETKPAVSYTKTTKP